MRKTCEEIIAQTFTGMRDVRTPDGMEQRLLIALRQHQTAPIPFWRSLPQLRWQFAAIPAVAMLVAAILLSTHTGVPTTVTPIARRQASSGTLTAADIPNISPCIHSKSGCPPSLAPVSLGFHRVPRHGIDATNSAPASLTAADQQALDDTNAPSHPAPPMPLTAQERLLLLATRKGQPIEVAELEPLRETALRAAAEARERASIRQYARSLLAPLALSESLNPTVSSQHTDDVQPAPAPAQPPPASN